MHALMTLAHHWTTLANYRGRGRAHTTQRAAAGRRPTIAKKSPCRCKLGKGKSPYNLLPGRAPPTRTMFANARPRAFPVSSYSEGTVAPPHSGFSAFSVAVRSSAVTWQASSTYQRGKRAGRLGADKFTSGRTGASRHGFTMDERAEPGWVAHRLSEPSLVTPWPALDRERPARSYSLRLSQDIESKRRARHGSENENCVRGGIYRGKPNPNSEYETRKQTTQPLPGWQPNAL